MISTLLSGIVIAYILKNNPRELKKYLFLGITVASIDFVIEFLGTTRGDWVYNRSALFLLNLIPIELVMIFFSFGIVFPFLFWKLRKVHIPIKTNHLLYVLISASFIAYLTEYILGVKPHLLPFAATIGIWAVFNLSDKSIKPALLTAITVFFMDFIIEKILISHGSYTYQNGFDIPISIIYMMLTLGLFALVEKLAEKY